jgi:predicted nucleic acid-binding protein
MIYLLDTNVVCESTARQPDPKVLAWCETHLAESLISTITVGEIWKGIHLLPPGKRRNNLAGWAARMEEELADCFLPLDTEVLKTWGEFYASHEAKGLNLGVLDSLIAATALVHGLTVVTRNTSDFPPPIRTLNPWNA